MSALMNATTRNAAPQHGRPDMDRLSGIARVDQIEALKQIAAERHEGVFSRALREVLDRGLENRGRRSGGALTSRRT